MPKLFIHPGFPKTATTSLQDHFFGRHPQILHLAQPYDTRTREMEEVLMQPDGYFDADRFRDLFDRITAGDDGKKVRVLSEEAYITYNSLRAPIARRLHELFPDAEIVFTIRNQIDCLKSYYVGKARMLRGPAPYRNRHVTLENYLQFSMARWERSFLGTMNYERAIRFYEELFGRDRIHILTFEDFIGDRDGFFADLCRILGVDAAVVPELFTEKSHSNARSTSRLVFYTKLRSVLLPNVPLRDLVPGGARLHGVLEKYLSRGATEKVEIPEKWKMILSERYAAGNRALAENYGLDLKKYDYPL